jgi:hypothetical protein
MLVLLVLQREGGEVDPRGPPFGTLEQYGDIVRADVQYHLLVQQAVGFLLGEGELLVADLAHLSRGPEPPQWQRWVRAAEMTSCARSGPYILEMVAKDPRASMPDHL